METLDVLSEKQLQAKTKLILAIREAKSRSLDVDALFIDYEGRLSRQKVLNFGLVCSILFTFITPYFLWSIKVWCAVHSYKVDLPEDMITNFTYINGCSMVAYGFGTGANTVLKILRSKRDEHISKKAVTPNPLSDSAFHGRLTRAGWEDYSGDSESDEGSSGGA